MAELKAGNGSGDIDRTATGQAGPSPLAAPVLQAPNDPAPPVAINLHLLLALDEAAADRLKRDATDLLPGAKRPLNRRVRQVFWDTAEHQIARAGLAIGIQTQARRKTQLVRDLTPQYASRIERDFDQPLTGDRLDLTRLAFVPGADAASIAGLSVEQLVPSFGLDIGRTSWKVAFGDSLIGVTLDAIAIEATEGRIATRLLVDLALLSGSPHGVFRLAESWIGRLEFRLAERDGVREGDLLARGETSPARRAVKLGAEMSVRDGFLTVARIAAQAIRIEVGALTDGLTPEQIHQARVALRRLRSLLSVFGPALPPLSAARVAKRLNAMASALGHIREWDVLLADTFQPLDKVIGPDPGLDEMIRGARGLRDRTAQALSLVRLDRDLQTLSLEFSSWFDAGLWPEPESAEEAALLAQPLVTLAGELLRRRHRKLTRHLDERRREHTPDDSDRLHELRIQAKKLRYTAELLSPLYPARATRRYIAALRSIQEILGVANDAVVARTLITRLVEIDRPAGARAFGLITGWTAAEAATARRRFDEAAKAFVDQRRFWR